MSPAMNQESALRIFLELTRHMLQKAQSEDWQTLVSLEETRKSLITDLFALPLVAEHGPAVAEAIREMLAIDQQIMVLSEAGRQQAANGMRHLQQSHRAMHAYEGSEGQVA